MKEEMSSAFSEQVLSEKLSKLNNSQQSIETLSHWCIFHRKKAKQVVETWEKQFNLSNKEQKVCFLYLANDILQNSKRKGGEFVNEFWKVLPPSLKSLYENGEESGKKVVTRLIEIWDERKVFGSRSRGLKDDILGDAPPPVLDKPEKGSNSNPNSNSNSNPIKVVKKDANTVRIKLSVGGMPEKIVTAYQSLLDEHFGEDTALNKCISSVFLLDKIEKDVSDSSVNGNQQQVSALMSEIQEQETTLKECVQQLESIESLRGALINQLKEALQEQESKSEHVHAQLQAARNEIDHALRMKQRLSPLQPMTVSLNSSPNNSSSPLLVTTLAPATVNPGDDFKKTAAAVAAKLAASTSSAQVLSSVLSSFAAQQAQSNPNPNTPPGFTPAEKKPRLDTPFQPPLPPVPPPAQLQQFTGGQNNGGGIMGLLPFSFTGSAIPPPPSMPPPPPAQQQPPPPPLPPPAQQQNSSGGFYPSPGIGFFGQLQPAPSAQRQQ